MIAVVTGYLTEADFSGIADSCHKISAMLNNLIKRRK